MIARFFMLLKTISNYFLEKTVKIDGEPELVGSGDFGDVYRMEDNKVCKILKNKSLIDLCREYSNQKNAFREEIKVPEPYGVYKIKIFGKTMPGLIMDDLGDLTLNKLNDDLRKKALEQFWEEFDNALKKGFFPQDHNYINNAIYVPKENQVYLIDCGFWHIDSLVLN